MTKPKHTGERGIIGRPSVYNADEHPAAAERACRNGATLEELSQLIGVSRSTVQLWMGKHPEFSVAIRGARETADDRVERSLFERAIGYSHKSEKIVVLSDGQGAGSHVERVPIIEHCPPDVAAIRLWLLNRRPQDWRDKQAIEHSGRLTLEDLVAQASTPRPPDGTNEKPSTRMSSPGGMAPLGSR